jgi:hypothetical protein
MRGTDGRPEYDGLMHRLRWCQHGLAPLVYELR